MGPEQDSGEWRPYASSSRDPAHSQLPLLITGNFAIGFQIAESQASEMQDLSGDWHEKPPVADAGTRGPLCSPSAFHVRPVVVAMTQCPAMPHLPVSLHI